MVVRRFIITSSAPATHRNAQIAIWRGVPGIYGLEGAPVLVLPIRTSIIDPATKQVISVVPAQAGTQWRRPESHWIPACAGTTS